MTGVDMLGVIVTIPEQAMLNVVAFCNPPGTKPEPLGLAKPDDSGYPLAELMRVWFKGIGFSMTTALERGAPLGLELAPMFRLRGVVI